jgi:[acyl-carrier-protein] S-malonyltransferase
MLNAQQDFTRAVESSPIQEPHTPLIGNVSASPLRDIPQIQSDLKAQLTSRVRWTESIQYIISAGVDTFIEIGNSAVLSGLTKRIDREVNTVTLGSPEDFEKLADIQ